MATQNPFENKSTSDSYQSTDLVYSTSAKAILNVFAPDLLQTHAQVVDLGAGTGVSTAEILKYKPAKLTIVEPSMAMLENAASVLGPGIEYIHSSAEKMFEHFDSNVDLIYACNCFHLFQDLASVLASIACTLKPKGFFVFNLTSPAFRFDTLTETQKLAIKANRDFYSALNQLSPNDVLAYTSDLLQKALDGTQTQVYFKDQLEQIFPSVGINLSNYQEQDLEYPSVIQKNIWRMMGQSFTQDQEALSKIIEAIELPSNIAFKQAVFVMQKV